MLFNSVFFLLVFLPVVWLSFNKAKQVSNTSALATLLLASLFFYSWWDWRFTGLLIASAGFNYLFGALLSRNRSVVVLWVGILANLAPLVYFKYAAWIASIAGGHIDSLVLPLGISFFTFLQIAYLVQIYRGTLEDRGPLAYAVFVTYFPHLIAGPILRHNEVVQQLAQIDRQPVVKGEMFARGLMLLVVGLTKKVLIADVLCAGLANTAFAQSAELDFTVAWTGALAYTLQLYFDFSGYCEMALGMSLLFGISIPVNFRSPYQAVDIADFWRRWHISLSTWFREHVYIPLGGNRNGPRRAAFALAVTFLLTGLWHGAGWTFLVWGALHAGYVVTFRAWRTIGRPLPAAIARIITLLSVVFAWVIFRAGSLQQAMDMWAAMLGLKGITLGVGFKPFAQSLPAWVHISQSSSFVGTEILLLILGLMWCARARNVHDFQLQPNWRHASAIGTLAAASMLMINRGSDFLYFSF